ncbi:MAG: UDP-N-acetylmuramate:L-alanyl-gamma-D-glutamyl-meso-diaminopimelate ligase [Proteobacteria bacterium]|nr:UDP-N-acetylmuramate:L-alanyl-gamma-D-glutamyl-meso-diaminopimelate ligase [Desulfobacula sp.]MBU4131124.1 UDP-N-acetylmuramate:L-alanyl-gamma-D-glutamyl-meso-diaminopimelate ligase [Pseudomonadota bacterium]
MGKVKKEKIHLVAACGTGMGTLACILKEMGHPVTGSDQNVYPPMSNFLAEKGIRLFSGFDPENLAYGPDLVIIGNAVSRENPEARAVLDQQIPYLSMPQAVNRFVARGKKIILVTGTHGKTTTSSIMAHLLETAGLSPSFLVGGILRDFNSSFQIGSGDYMVIEGDEYDTAFFDKGPKFMHYDPYITIMTGVEFDHADIFRDIDHIKEIFSAFVRKIEAQSHIIACLDNENLNQVLTGCTAVVETYGQGGDWRFSDHTQRAGLTQASIQGPGKEFSIETGLVGRHNLMNTLACIAAASKLGISDTMVQKALASFSGVKRRQEIRGIRKGITVMDDFAHHPSAVRETIAAVKPFYGKGRIMAVFEPRTNTSMRQFFQQDYPDAFLAADKVLICNPCVKKNIPEEQRFSTEQLVADIIKKGGDAYHFETPSQVLAYLVPELRENDLVLIMSNGGFENIHNRLLASLE